MTLSLFNSLNEFQWTDHFPSQSKGQTRQIGVSVTRIFGYAAHGPYLTYDVLTIVTCYEPLFTSDTSLTNQCLYTLHNHPKSKPYAQPVLLVLGGRIGSVCATTALTEMGVMTQTQFPSKKISET